MPSDHYSSDRDLHQGVHTRPEPKCYARSGMSQTISGSRVDTESNAILSGLSVITCIAGFVLVYGGWSF